MASRDNISKVKVFVVSPLATNKTTVPSAAVDTQGWEAVGFTITAGPSGDTLAPNTAIEWDVQDSPDETTWSAVPDALINVQITPANPTGTAVGLANGAANTGCAFLATSDAQIATNFEVRVGYVGIQRYVRINELHSGTQGSGTPSMILAVLSEPTYEPFTGNLT